MVSATVILSLLALNSAYYVVAGRASEALDSIAWFVLLILFTLEALPIAGITRALTLMRLVRLIAAAAIAAAAAGYVIEREWLDAANIFLWIAVVVLLEIELRCPDFVARHRSLFTGLALLLYSGLGLLVAIWLTRGEWMDAWDAALWLVAFGVLEMYLLSGKK